MAFAVENMFPWRAAQPRDRGVPAALGPPRADYPAITLDLSHTAVSGSDALVVEALGDRLRTCAPRRRHGPPEDEHLVPGRGNQPCAEVLEWLARAGFTGTVVVEVNTRRAGNRDERENDLAEALAFARLNLATAVPAMTVQKDSSFDHVAAAYDAHRPDYPG